MLWAHGKGMDFTLIETMPMGDIDGDRTDQYLPLSLVRSLLAQRFTLEESDYRDRRAGALRARGARPAGGSGSSRRSRIISARAATGCG